MKPPAPFSDDLRAAHQEVLWPLAALIPFPLPWTGAASWPMVLFYEALLAAVFLRARAGRPWRVSNLLLNVSAAIYLVWFYFEVRQLRHGLVRTASHLLLFTAAAKLLSLRSAREERTAILLLFLLALDSASTSVHVTVLLYLTALVFVAYRALARLALLADFDAAPPIRTLSRIPTAGISLVSVVGIIGFAAPLFVALPRLRTPFAQAPLPADADGASFFTTDRVDLGTFSAAKHSDRIVLTVTPIRGPLPSFMRLRETSFNRYSGGRWWREGVHGSSGAADARGRVELSGGPAMRTLEVEQATLNPGYLFLPYGSSAVLTHNGSVIVSGDGTVASALRGRGELFQAEYSPAGTVGAPGRFAVIRSDIPAAVAQAAARAAGGATERPEIARRLFNYLQKDFTYTLDPPAPSGEDPVADFLTRTHRGHCEYFASALALMLASQGIPARLATGSLGGEEGLFSSTVVVRGSNLHAWVEADIGGRGFQMIDPTPAEGRPGIASIPLWKRLFKAGNEIEFYYDRNILGFDTQDQVGIVESVREILRRLEAIGQVRRIPVLRLAFGAAILSIGIFVGIVLSRRAARQRRPPAAELYLALRRLHRRQIGPLPDSAPPAAVVKGFSSRGRIAGQAARRIVDVYRKEAFAGEAPSSPQIADLRRALSKIRKSGALAGMILVSLCPASRRAGAAPQTGVPAPEPQEASAPATVTARYEDLKALQARLEESRRKLASVEKKEADLKHEVEALDLRLEIATTEREVIAARRDELARQARTISADLTAAQTARESAAAALGGRIRLLSRFGRFGYLRILLSAHDSSEVFSALKTLHALARADAGALSRFSEASRRLKGDLAIQLASAEQAERLLAEDREQERRVASLKAERVALLRRSETEASQTRQEVSGLSQKAEKLENLLDLLSRGESEATGSPRPWKGVLDWPAQGKIAVTFGRHRHPKFDAWTVSNGIEIDASDGAPVFSVYAGKVVFARWFPEYGNMVVIDHGDQVLTLYARLRSALVHVGDIVAGGDRVGLVGVGPGESDPSLYFEVRDHQKAADPLTWLR